MLRHTGSSIEDSIFCIDLEPYRGQFEYQWIRCIHCRASMMDYYDLDHWPYRFADFEQTFHPQAQAMVRLGLVGEPACVDLVDRIFDRQSILCICPMCAWWCAIDSIVVPAVKRQIWLLHITATSALMDLALDDISTPLMEVRNHLRRRYEDRHYVHPRVFEEVVASVFRDCGYDACATAYTNDGGIDVVLAGVGGKSIGVQVKRHRRSIQVEQIRSFLGALLLKGHVGGMFVSTSPFQRGAARAAQTASATHVPIELIDADRFFSMLEIAQLSQAPEPEDCGFFDSGRRARPFLHSCLNLNSL